MAGILRTVGQTHNSNYFLEGISPSFFLSTFVMSLHLANRKMHHGMDIHSIVLIVIN